MADIQEDGYKLTVKQLKSIISENGFTDKLPTTKTEKKDFYVNIYHEFVLPKLHKEAESQKRSIAAHDEENVAPQTGPATPNTIKKRIAKRRKTVAPGSLTPLSKSTKSATVPEESSSTAAAIATPVRKRIAKRRNSSRASLASPGGLVPLSSPSASTSEEDEIPPPRSSLRQVFTAHQSQEAADTITQEEDLLLAREPESSQVIEKGSSSEESSEENDVVTTGSAHDEGEPIGDTEESSPDEDADVDEHATLTKVATSIVPITSPEQSLEYLRSRNVDAPSFIASSAPAESSGFTSPIPNRSVYIDPSLLSDDSSDSPKYVKAPARKSHLDLRLVLAVGAVIAAILLAVFFPTLLEYSGLSSSAAPPTRFCNTGAIPDGACTPCPLHGSCINNELRQCEPTYIISDGQCLKDEELVRNSIEMKHSALDSLAYVAGCYQCGYVDTPEVSETELREQLIGKEPDANSAKVFQYMADRLGTDKNVKARLSSTFPRTAYFFVTPENARIPLGCWIRQRLWDIKEIIGILVLIASGLLYVIYKRSQAEKEGKLVEELVEEVKNILVGQRQYAASATQVPSWVPVTHVRDTLFHDHAERKKTKVPVISRLWSKVEESISNDVRIKTTRQLVDGQQQTVWEWASHLPATNRLNAAMSPTAERASGESGSTGATASALYPKLSPVKST